MVGSADTKRARILEAARAVCARCGFESARMEEIAARARVSKGTLYRFFPSKEDLLLASLIDSHEAVSYAGDPLDDLAAVAPGCQLEHTLEQQARRLAEASRRMLLNMQAWGLVAGDASRRERLYRTLREGIYPQRAAPLRAALEADVRAGSLRPGVDAEGFVATLLAVFDGFLYRSTFDPEHAHEEALRASFRTLLESIRAPVGEKSRG